MKSILFIFNGLTKNNGKVGISGGDIRLSEIIKNTDKEIVNLLTTPNGLEFSEKIALEYSQKFLINYEIDAGIWSNLKISLLSLFALPKGLNRFKDQIVYSSCEHLYDVLPALRLKILNKNKWYAVYHWVEDFPWKEKRGGTPFLKRYLYWLNRAFSGWLIKVFADEILAVSDQTREKLIEIKKVNPKKIKAVYCGVEYEKIVTIAEKYKKEAGTKYDAVYMKRLNHGKGIFDLLKIWKKVCETKKDAKLGIIGDGSQDVVNSIKNFIKENSLEKNIDLLGVVYDFEEKFRILNSSKLFVLPTHEENWAIVIGEAMAIKLPVICYRLKEIEPIWKDNLQWVEVGDTESFAKNVLDYLNSSEKRKALSNKAFGFVKQYDWKNIATDEFILKKNMKKIAIDSRCFNSLSGIARYLDNILLNLFEIDKINEYYLLMPNHFSLLDRYAKYKNVQLVNLNIKSDLKYKFLSINKFLDKNKIDIFWTPTQDSLIFKPKTAKIVLTVHDIAFEHYPEWFSWKINLLSKIGLYKKFIKDVDYIFYDSQFSKDDVEKTYNLETKGLVTYLGASKVFKKIYKIGAKKFVSEKFNIKSDYIFYLDTVRFKRLFDAFKAFSSTYKDVKLVCLGKFGGQDVVEYAKEKGIDDKIVWIKNRVDDLDLNNLYSGSEFFVSPSEYEGFGLTPLEALQSGTPILISNTTSLPEVFKDSALYCDPYSVDDIYKNMIKLYKNKELQKNILANSEKLYEIYDWNKVTQSIHQVFVNHL